MREIVTLPCPAEAKPPVPSQRKESHMPYMWPPRYCREPMCDVVMVVARRARRKALVDCASSFLHRQRLSNPYAREQMEEAEKLFTNLRLYRSLRRESVIIVTNLPQDPRHGIGVPRRQRGTQGDKGLAAKSRHPRGRDSRMCVT
jgi:hypothetical protein